MVAAAELTQGMGTEQGKKQEQCATLGRSQQQGVVTVSLGRASEEELIEAELLAQRRHGPLLYCLQVQMKEW